MNQEALEPYVSPEDAAAFLKIKRLKLIRMARSGSVPAYPLGPGKRRQWRFKLSELDKHMQERLNDAHPLVRHTRGD
jgi:excisionase family DNA binding protein